MRLTKINKKNKQNKVKTFLKSASKICLGKAKLTFKFA